MCKKFPSTPAFEYFLGTLKNSIEVSDEDYDEILIFEESIGVTNDDKNILIPAKKLYIKNDVEISFEAVTRKIEIALKSLNHFSSHKIASIILYCYSFIPNRSESVKSMNELLSWNAKADLNQFVIFSFKNKTNFNLKFGEFRFGTLDHKRLKLYCNKFKTDYFDLYGHELIGNFSIERNYFKVPILDLANILNKTGRSLPKLNEGFFSYYEELSKFYFDSFEHEFREQQNLMTFLNEDYLDINDWKFMFAPWQLSIFLNIASTKNGWIVPKGKGGITINLASSDKRYIELKDSLKNEFKFENFNDTDIDHTLDLYLKFCAKAKRYKKKSIINESFLHYVIALDLLFGEKDSSTNSVATRTAVCIHNAFGQSYLDTNRKVKNIYSERSKYVHAGKNVSIESFEYLEKICLEIFYVILRNYEKSKSWKSATWLKKIDILIAKINAELLPEKKEYNDLGIK